MTTTSSPISGRGRDGVIRRRPAVDGDDELGALGANMAECRWARAIALGHAVGNVDGQLAPHGAKPAHELGGAGRAVDVVVGEHDAGSVAHDGVDEELGRAVHVEEA